MIMLLMETSITAKRFLSRFYRDEMTKRVWNSLEIKGVVILIPKQLLIAGVSPYIYSLAVKTPAVRNRQRNDDVIVMDTNHGEGIVLRNQ